MTKSSRTIDFDYQLTDQPITALGGLPVFLEAARALGLEDLFDQHFHIKQRKRGYREYELALAVILSLVAGGESLEDGDKIRLDEVVGKGHFPHSTTVGDFLRRFDTEAIFAALDRVQDELNRSLLAQFNLKQLTLDIDATFIAAEGHKRQGTAKVYHNGEGFQPLLVFAAEVGLILAQEFRPANVYPGKGAVDLLSRAQTLIPRGTRLHLRSDSACYDREVVVHCETAGITFTIAADLTAPLLASLEALPPKAWQALGGGLEIAQLTYQPSLWPKPYRYIVTRKIKKQDLFGPVYSYRAVVTNIFRGNPHLILKRHNRHANVENDIKELKGGFSMCVMPCLAYRANRAWFELGILANNLWAAVKRLFLPRRWWRRTIKTVRFRLLHLGGVWVKHARRQALKISRRHPWHKDLLGMRQRIKSFA